MNISQVARRSGLPAKTIRYYEDIGLLEPARDSNGYRVFSSRDLHRLAFLGRARNLGFSLSECRSLLALWGDPQRASSDVKKLAAAHLDRIDVQIAQMQHMRDTLADLVQCCAGDARPDCPILKDLEQGTEA